MLKGLAGGGWLTWAEGKRQGGLAGSKYARVNTPWKSNGVGSKRNSRKILLKHEEVSDDLGWAELKALARGNRGSPNLSGSSNCPGASLRQCQDLRGCCTAQSMGAQAHGPRARGRVCFQDRAGL